MPPQRHRDQRRHKSTTSLPAALRDELGLPSPPRSNGGGGGRYGSSSSVIGRKDARKAERQEKKGLRVIGRGTSAAQGEKGRQIAEQKAEERRREREKAKEEGMRVAKERQRIAAEAAQKEASRDKKSSGDTADKKRKLGDEATSGDKKKKKEKKAKETPSGRPSPYEPALGEASGSTSRQRQGVSSTHETPLQRLLARQQGGSSSASSKDKGKSRAPAAQEETERERKLRRMRMTQAERDEEDEIAWLEHKLGKGASKASKKAAGKKGAEDEEAEGLEDDGLDDLLDDLDRFYPGMYDEDAKADDSEEELAKGMGLDEEIESSGDEDEEDDDDEDEDDDEEDDEDDEDTDIEASDDQASDDSELENEEEGPDSEEDADEEASEPVPAAVAPPTGKYIPPAARAAAAAAAAAASGVLTSEAETLEQQKLRRQAKGLLNRLGDGNIESILNEIEALYRVHKRADVTSCITRLILDMISARSNLIDTLVILYATFAGALHHIVGIEYGAHFVQTLVDDFFKHYYTLPPSGSTEGDDGEVGRECLNLAALLAQLYNLQIVACPLIYDMIRLFLGQGAESGPKSEAQAGLREIDVELLLKVVKACGSQLRHDDATSLKSIIALAKERAAAASPSADGQAPISSSRARFMLESLADLKNNRHKAVAASEASPAGQALTRMKKFLGGLGKKRTLRTHEALRVTLRDLKDAETKGKWWLVGAAWAGKGTGENEGTGVTSAAPLPGASSTSSSSTAVKGKDAKLLALAKSHGMNTEARRSVFVTLLGAEDYIDAAQRLSTLKLKGTQQREVVRVLLHCIGSEKAYNPYYALVGAQLAAESPGTRVTMQYCLWDFFRELGEKNVGGRSIIEREDDDDDGDGDALGGSGVDDKRLANLARAFGWWFAKGSLGLEVLKPLDFPLLKAASTRLVRLLLVHFLLSTQTAAPMATLVLSKAPEAKLPAGAGMGGLPSFEDDDDEDGGFQTSRDASSKSALHFKKDRAAIERPLVKASTLNLSVAQGLLLFMERHLSGPELLRIVGQGPKADATTQRVLSWAAGVASKTLKVAATKSLRKQEADFFD